MVKLFLPPFSIGYAITALLTPIWAFSLLAAESVTDSSAIINSPNLKSPLSRMICADEVKDFSKIHGESPFFDLTVGG
ncbi:hypothetical protein [Candidatus Odyssella acanthamoebae]|uniref:hypothetical protein n=1 Tax=Candidatus Odyssella acanthamoebae TaxID=91604 RepID=UPI0012EB6276|nr:hypothetical protein [Candidatus Paracaedibacter acanthamoebae]